MKELPWKIDTFYPEERISECIENIYLDCRKEYKRHYLQQNFLVK